MMIKKALIALLFCVPSAPAFAASTAQEAYEEYARNLSKSYRTLSVFMSNNFQKSAGFSSGAHGFAPPAARKKFGFNVGLMGGFTASQMDKKAASTGLADEGMVKFVNDMPAVIPMGQGGLNLHYGLPAFFVFESFDVGLRTMVFNGELGDGKGFLIGTEQRDIGLDLRGNIFESGLVSPVTLTLGLSIDSYKAKVWLKKVNIDLNDTTTVQGFTRTGKVDNHIDNNMENLAYHLRAVVSRKFLFFTPYFGVAAQVNSGSADTRGFQTGTVTFRNGGGSYTSSAEIEGKAAAPVSAMDVRLGGGFELDFKFVYLSFNGEYGAVSGGYGGNVQLGGKFR